MILRAPFALLLLSAACTREDAVKLGTYEVVAEPSAAVPTVIEASWEAPSAGTTWLEYGLDGAFDQQTPPEPADGGQEHAELRGLKAGRTYELRAVTETADGERLESEVSTLEVEPPPPEAPRFSATSLGEGETSSAAFVLTTLIEPDRTWIAILDRDGDLVWSWELDEGVSASEARFLKDSDSVAWLQYDVDQVADLGTIVRVSFDGSEEVRTRALRGHHSFVALPGDRYAWLSFDSKLMDVEGEPVWVTADTILEVEEGADDSVEPREIFSFFEDYSSIFVTCDHFWDAPPYAEGGAEFSHANSLVYDEAADRFWMMNRNLDNLLEIERADGAIVTEIGGALGVGTGIERDMWSHGHFSQIWEGGFTVFDNGYHHDPQVSRVNEYAFDRERGELSLVWTSFAGNRQFLELLGDVKRLEDSHLVSWTESGMITEIDDAGDVTWKVEAEIGTAVGRLAPVQSLYDLESAEP